MVTREEIPTYITHNDTHWKFYYRGVRCEFWLHPEENIATYNIEMPDDFPETNVPTLAKSVIKEQMCDREDITCSQLEFERK